MRTILLLSQIDEVQDWLVAFLKEKNARNIAYIMDAKRPRLLVEKDYVFKDKLAFEAAGLNVKIVDLESTESTKLEAVFENIDAVYVKGGNSFYLLNAMRKSGFDQLVNKLLDKGVIYIGESAGAYVACPTIEMAHWKHQDRDIVGLDNLTGLNIIPFLVSVHYTDGLKTVLEPYIKACKYDVKLIRNDEVVLSEDGTVKLIQV